VTAGGMIDRCVLFVAALATIGCATAPFHRHLAAREWGEAASEFASDTTLLKDPDALYAAGVLFGTPGRETYDPDRGADLLEQLLARFPDARHRTAAVERLALLNEIRGLRLELERLKEVDFRPRTRRPLP